MFLHVSVIQSILKGGACMVAPRGGVHGCSWGACMVKGGYVTKGGMRGKGGLCMAKGGMHGEGGMRGEGGVCGKGGHVWQRGACMAKGGMCGEGGVCVVCTPWDRYGRSLRRRYTSYWNAFLFLFTLIKYQVLLCIVRLKSTERERFVLGKNSFLSIPSRNLESDVHQRPGFYSHWG